MKEVFEKIKEKCIKDSRIGRKSFEAFIEIVNQVAEEHASDKNVGNKDELLIHVIHGYDSLESPTDEMCFGCYVKGKNEIYVADDMPKEQFFQTIAHEYMHYLQDIEGKDFNEEEADAFAGDINIRSNDGWIPCKKDLPKITNSYLVTKVCKNDGNPIYETAHEIFWIKNMKWDCERDEYCEWEVIAWREKLEPYKPKGKDNEEHTYRKQL